MQLLGICFGQFPGSSEKVDHFDAKLNLKHHINVMVCRLSSIVGVLKDINNLLSYKWLRMLYNSSFLSQVNYCCIIWGSAQNSTIKNRFAPAKDLNDNLECSQIDTEWVHAKIKSMTVSELCELHLLVFNDKYKRKLLPCSFSEILHLAITYAFKRN